MGTWQFAYSEIPIPPSDPFPNGQTVRRPLLHVRITATSTGQSLVCLGWPDSGADHCVFPLSFASAIGLDPLQLKMHMTGGVGSIANATYYAELRIEIPTTPTGPILSFTTLAGFTQGMDAQGLGLLGQAGFFEHFTVGFKHAEKMFALIELKP